MNRVGEFFREVSVFEWIFINVSVAFVSAVDDSHSVDQEIWAVDYAPVGEHFVVCVGVGKLVIGCTADDFAFQDRDGLVIKDGTDGIGCKDVAFRLEHLKVTLKVNMVYFNREILEKFFSVFNIFFVDVPGNNLRDSGMDQVFNNKS